MRRMNPTILAAAAIGFVLLLVGILMLTRKGSADQDKLTDNGAATAAAAEPDRRCASQGTYDRIKLELFRQAAQMRSSDQATFDKLAAYASVRMDRPLLREHDEELGTVRCTGRLSLDLPPGVAVVGGRRTLSADIDYVLQPAADGSGDVVMLEGADPIIVPLATLARSGDGVPLPQVPQAGGQVPVTPGVAGQAPPVPIPGYPPQEAPRPQPQAEPPPAEPQPEARPEPQPSASARPSFNCRYARTRGEIAVCSDGGLAALDRQMASQFYRALSAANARQRSLLTSTRTSFLRYRDRCPTNACIAETYRGRMREIRDIMAGTWRPER